MDEMIIDNNQQNADFVKFGGVDIPGISHIYQLFDYVGVDYLGDNGPQEIMKFVTSHPWLYDMGMEARWVIDEANKKVNDQK